MFLRKFLNKKNLVNIFNKFKNYEIYGLTGSRIQTPQPKETFSDLIKNINFDYIAQAQINNITKIQASYKTTNDKKALKAKLSDIAQTMINRYTIEESDFLNNDFNNEILKTNLTSLYNIVKNDVRLYKAEDREIIRDMFDRFGIAHNNSPYALSIFLNLKSSFMAA